MSDTPTSEDRAAEAEPEGHQWTFRWEAPVHEAFPALHAAQSAWLSEIDELHSPDRKTRELIRLVCNVALRSAPGVGRHAGLAAEYGARWEEVLGALMLTTPSFGVLPAAELVGVARQAFEAATRRIEAEANSNGDGNEDSQDTDGGDGDGPD